MAIFAEIFCEWLRKCQYDTRRFLPIMIFFRKKDAFILPKKHEQVSHATNYFDW